MRGPLGGGGECPALRLFSSFLEPGCTCNHSRASGYCIRRETAPAHLDSYIVSLAANVVRSSVPPLKHRSPSRYAQLPGIHKTLSAHWVATSNNKYKHKAQSKSAEKLGQGLDPEGFYRLIGASLTGALGNLAGRKAAAEGGKGRRLQLVIGEIFCWKTILKIRRLERNVAVDTTMF
ncbi:hypothetical protein COCC4DRAFT_26154 [Bipolaris maydis ATCC 48331]|uniref:Uncharacterized protein n=1 Tax=Cochliobolus heterostrophus (strain C4 / ATCC 48331 / race T) TaxID=665024 RepID=N4X9R9_COCH4|nr:uncharacterized protein COCC4DRAFT_26154 [Bipolaris maydis ATCC 48331]ENI01937.1 hypothetical protein COCC4DRAFT_26154 [Bipolaris maydis ATCC 48331]